MPTFTDCSVKVMDLLHEAYLSFVQNEGFNYLHGVSIQSNQCPELLVVNIFRFQGHGTNENFTGVKIDTKVEVPYVSAHRETGKPITISIKLIFN